MTDEVDSHTVSEHPKINALSSKLIKLCEDRAKINSRMRRLEKRLRRANNQIDEICKVLKEQEWNSRPLTPKGRDGRVMRALAKRAGEIMSPSDLFRVLNPKEKLDTQGGEYTMIVSSLGRLIKEGRVEKVERGKYRACDGDSIEAGTA